MKRSFKSSSWCTVVISKLKMASSGGSGDSGVPVSSIKWQVALAVGVPVAVGVGIWYYRSSKKENSNNLDVTPKPATKSEALQSVSAEPAKEKTALAKAMGIKEKGNKYFKGGKYEEALKCYQEAIDVGHEVDNQHLATFYQNKAAAHEQLKDFEGVKQDCTMALTLNPIYVKALLRRAKAYENLKNLSKALVDITAACILENFQSHTTMVTADRILKELGRQHAKEAIAKKTPVTPSVYFIKTYFSSFSKDPLEAFSKDALTESSKGFLKALYLLKNGDYDSIIAACTEELNQTEAEASYKNEALLMRGTMHILTGQHSSAIADLEAVIENEDASLLLRVNALIKRASIHMQLEDTAACMADFNRAVTLDPDNPDIYHQRGQVNLLLERLEEAQKDFGLAVELNPTNPITKVQKCYTDYRDCLNKKDETKLQEVMSRFDSYIKEYPTCPECFTLYAQVLSDQQDCEKSDKLYQKALKLDPANASLLVHRAILALQWTGDITKAIALINEALQLDDKCGFACETLGTIQVQRGYLNEAIEMFDKAIEFAKSELELAHLYSLRDATIAQQDVMKEMNLRVPNADS